MEISTFLEVGISLIFVYLLSSILVSNLHEVLASAQNQRGKLLVKAMELILNDGRLNKNFAHLLYSHPQVERTRKNRARWPAYIAPRVFAQTLIDLIGEETTVQQAQQNTVTKQVIVRDEPGTTDPLKCFRDGVELLNYSDLKVMLRSFARQVNSHRELVDSLESWYEDYMDRVTGWYKLSIRPQLFLIGLLTAVLLNIDTILLSRALWQQSLLRSQVVKAADAFVENNRKDIRTSQDVEQKLDTLKKTYGQLTQLQLPIGWRIDPTSPGSQGLNSVGAAVTAEIRAVGLLPKLTGWLLTGIALMFGAPFWFDILRYLVNVRQAGIKPQPRPKPPVS